MTTLNEAFDRDVLAYVEEELFAIVGATITEALRDSTRKGCKAFAPAVLADLRRTIEGKKTVNELRLFYDKYARRIALDAMSACLMPTSPHE